MRIEWLIATICLLMITAAKAETVLSNASESVHVSTPKNISTTPEEDKNSWDSDFGRMSLIVAEDGNVTGNYPKYSGQIKGQVNPEGLIEAIWFQPTSKQRCETMKEGSYYWGKVSWKVVEQKYLRGGWSYCDDPAGSGGAWNGDKPSVGKAFASFFSGLLRIAGKVAGSQLGGGVGGSLAGMAMGQATNAAASAVENSGSEPSASSGEETSVKPALSHKH